MLSFLQCLLELLFAPLIILGYIVRYPFLALWESKKEFKIRLGVWLWMLFFWFVGFGWFEVKLNYPDSYYTLFSNDGPLGLLCSQQCDNFFWQPVWKDLNWIGLQDWGCSVSVQSVFSTLCYFLWWLLPWVFPTLFVFSSWFVSKWIVDTQAYAIVIVITIFCCFMHYTVSRGQLRYNNYLQGELYNASYK